MKQLRLVTSGRRGGQIVSTVIAASMLSLLVEAHGAGGPTQLSLGPTFFLEFSSAGYPASFKVGDDGAELVATADPGLGFYLISRDNAPLRLDNLTWADGKLVASCGVGLPRVTFRIHEGDSYVALTLERIEGVPATPEYSLHFQMNVTRRIGVLELGYMSEARVSDEPGGPQLQVDWRHLWNRNPENAQGGVAIYSSRNPQDEDDTILKIWVGEQLPHPRVKGPWDLAAAQAWVKRWLDLHGDQSRFWVHASSPEELYAAVPYAEESGTRDVYLFTDVWRGGESEPFWNVSQPNGGINKKVFPRGEEDLRAFSEHLRQRGMNLKLHWISGTIGFKDPHYVGKSPDDRLASWGRGRLARPVEPDDTTLYFRPDSGVNAPYRSPADWWKRYTFPPSLHPVFDFQWMVVGDEVIKVASFEDTDQAVWRLEGCQRGQFTTEAVSHPNGEPSRGLITSYEVALVPENDSTLLEEVARNYAEMLNRIGSPHVEFDGAEVHTYNGRSWGFNKFSSLVYSHLECPSTSFTSGGAAPRCFLEYRLNATKKVSRERQKGNVAILADEPHRPASNLLDAHWGMSQTCAHDYTIYNIMRPEPMFGVNIKALEGHGLTGQMLDVAKNWKEVNRLASPDQREAIRKTMYYSEDLCGQAGNHQKSEVLHVLEKGADQWEIYPTRVLVRPGKIDRAWQDGQEHGAISPRQFVKPGEPLRLINPYEAQTPRIVLRCLWGFDPEGKAETLGVSSGRHQLKADAAFDYARALLAREIGETPQANILLQPSASELRNAGDTKVLQEGSALVIEGNNTLERPVVNEDKLPEWSRLFNMTKHRGIGMWVTGDNSGAVLAVQIPGGDYVVPINFTGRRYIEIPNAQVAWSTGYWGWRMGAKRSYYNLVDWMKVGFGVIPPKSSPKVKVEGITALQEIACELENPTFRVGESVLNIEGTVSSGQYLTWEGGPTCTVYDANWNELKKLPVVNEHFEFPQGEAELRIDAETSAVLPWLEVQVMTRDKPMVVPFAAAGVN